MRDFDGLCDGIMGGALAWISIKVIVLFCTVIGTLLVKILVKDRDIYRQYADYDDESFMALVPGRDISCEDYNALPNELRRTKIKMRELLNRRELEIQ